jgi:hypothetical protein
MCGILQRIFEAARDRDCPIVHISALEGEPPFIASTPCMGDRPEPLVDLSSDQYLGLQAEIWGALVIEFDRELPAMFGVRGARERRETSERTALPSRTVAGYLGFFVVPAAVQYTLDSYGQETTILYCGLRSFRDIQAYWRERGEVYRAFGERYACNERDRSELLRRLDRTVRPLTFDVEAFAAERGIREAALRYACR